VKTTNGHHRAVYLVLLLIFAVALTTGLVLAGEKNSGGKKHTLRGVFGNSISVQVKMECACEIA